MTCMRVLVNKELDTGFRRYDGGASILGWRETRDVDIPPIELKIFV